MLFVAGCPSSEQTDPPVNDTPAVSNKTPEPPPRAEEPADPLPIAGRTHVVQPHDTLYKLAEQYYGNSKYYRKILSANKRRLKDPNNLPVGMKLIIP